jgi:hypothetical protein
MKYFSLDFSIRCAELDEKIDISVKLRTEMTF